MTMNIELHASSDVLLVQIERKGLAVETHCRSGFCGMCRTRLVKGQVAYEEMPISFVDEGEVLVCCAKAKTDVTLEI
ncbi:TPA: class I ribonucleotide reductase maintenance protein YfaE [Aeromonas veronii]|uniref:class I ribonucleotide reductase maintenance protein YfaE n=1 Tax=Aeromonas veronii TaxID=654 RepID=UPI0030822CE4